MRYCSGVGLVCVNTLLVAGAVMVAFSSTALGGQTKIPNYRAARDTHFYKELYKAGGRTLYCQVRFETKAGLNVEHVYPASWMKDTAGCSGQSRKECRRTSKLFNEMEADLHNLFPALAEINQARANFTFAIIGTDVNEPDFGDCDFEIDEVERQVEVRPGARGEIARAVFYMHSEYALPIDPGLFRLLIQWHHEDDVSAEELRRNEVIAGIQGTRNKFISRPGEVVSPVAVSAESSSEDDRWEDCRIKGNISSNGRIYHVPGSRQYAQTKINAGKGEKWFCSEREAEAEGWRRAGGR